MSYGQGYGQGAASSYYQQQPYQQSYQQPNQQQPGQDQQQPGQDQQQQGQGPVNPPPPPPPYPKFDQVFSVQQPKWNDLWAGILFLVFVAGFAAVSGLSLAGYASTKRHNGNGISDGANDFGLSTNTIILFLICTGISVTLSYAYMWVARRFTKHLIYITGILNIALGLVTAIYMLKERYYSGGIVFLVFTVFMVIAFISWLPRIPFSVLMLQTAIDVARHYGHVYMVSLLGGLAATAFGVWYSITLVAVYVKYQPGNNPACDTAGGGCSNAKVIGLLVFITFTAYWISEWLKNTIHTTISGVYGSWYFHVNNFPPDATRGALKRSLTHSFGSISLGSLVVAIINFLRHICSVARQSAASESNIVSMILFCVLESIISVLEWVVRFVNRYAFSHIALYGKAYIPAAKDTWRMMKQRGIDALVNECLIGPVFSMGATFVGYACALCAYVYLGITDPAYNKDGGYTPVVVAFAFLIGLQICNVFTTPLSSGIDTIFVAMAWDNEVMMQDHADLYQRMVFVYPKVQQSIQLANV